MSSFLAKHFFDLDLIQYDLWQEDEPVWMALHRLETFFQTRTEWVCQSKIPPSVFLEHPETIAIGEDVLIEPGVYIQGPCMIGRRSIIRHGAYLRGGVICGEGCVIGHGSEIKRSILLDGAQVAHLDYVGDSILGHRVNLGAGVKCANLRLDRREIAIQTKEGTVSTGLKKFGCIIGDGCQIGCNVVINPGTLIGPHSLSYPLLNLSGVIPARTRIRRKGADLEKIPFEIDLLERLR